MNHRLLCGWYFSSGGASFAEDALMCFDYDGESEFFNSKTVRTRKPHRCSGCNKVIPTGSQAEYCAGKYDRDFFSYYACENCQRLIESIAAQELREGCDWSQAWCSIDDLQQYLYDKRSYGEEVELLQGTLEECRAEVVRLHQVQVAEHEKAWRERR